MAGKGGLVEPYSLSANFERTVVYLASSSRNFYDRVCSEINPDLLPGGEIPKLILQAAQAIAVDAGHGPGSVTLILQRLKRWMGEGKVTFDQITNADNLLGAAEDAGSYDEETVLKELVPILQHKLRGQALLESSKEYAARSNFAKVIDLVARANSLGKSDISIGERIGEMSFGEFRSVMHAERLMLGIPELDVILDGGTPLGSLGCTIAATGGGKSMFLSHIAARSGALGLFSAYATLELPCTVIMARIIANWIAMPINAILSGACEDEARRRLLAMKVGPTYVKDFTPGVTTPEAIIEWRKQIEARENHKINLLAVDYDDKLAGIKTEPRHEQLLHIYETLRLDAAQNRHVTWTASQGKAQAVKDSRARRSKRLDNEDTKYSSAKADVSDMVITTQINDDHTEAEYFISKNRLGVARKAVGPVPVDLSLGRMGPVAALAAT